MSEGAMHHSRRARYTCQRCRERQARFQYRGEVRADRDHTLCFECFRAERDRQQARTLTEATVRPAPSVPLVLDQRQVAHRWAMLANLARHRKRL